MKTLWTFLVAGLAACVLMSSAALSASAAPGGNGNGRGGDQGGGNSANQGGNGANQGGGNGANQGGNGANQGGGNGANQGGSGANQPGPYDPSGVGQPSGNGKSDDNNGKRPCAGCVGNADDKNPRGQLPGGSDHNKGYECDANQGVGKTNPAHSGCGTSTTTTPGGNPGGGNPGGENPGGETPRGGGPSSAGSTDETAPKSPSAPAPAAGGELQKAVAGEDFGRPVGAIVPASAAKPGQDSGPTPKAGLPFTGGRPLALALLGLMALAVGLCARQVRTAPWKVTPPSS